MKADITMFADASVQPKIRSAGWGCWIKGDGRSAVSAGGHIQEFTRDTSVAELEAILNGLSFAREQGYFLPADSSILIQSDCSPALAALRWLRPGIVVSAHADSAPIHPRRKQLRLREQSVVDRIFNVTDGAGLTIAVRHVRGHTSGDGRNWVNRHCDKLAKKGARAGAAPPPKPEPICHMTAIECFPRSLERIRGALARFYTPAEVETWLSQRHPQLGGLTAKDAMAAGRTADVEAIINRLESDGYV